MIDSVRNQAQANQVGPYPIDVRQTFDDECQSFLVIAHTAQ